MNLKIESIRRGAVRGLFLSTSLCVLILFGLQGRAHAAGGAVEGYVKDTNGSPIANIYVLVDNGDGNYPGDTTNSSGYYRIEGVNSGERNVVAARGTCCGGTTTDELYAMAHDYHVWVTEGQTTRKDFTLTQEKGQIHIILEGAADCKANIDIVVDSTQNDAYGIGKTDAYGETIIDRIRPSNAIYVTTLKKGNCNQTRVGPITVTNGGTTEIHLTQTQGGNQLWCGVKDADGSWVNGASVFVNGSSDSEGGTGVCNAVTGDGGWPDGHFECYLPSGNYDIHIWGVPGYPSYIRYGLPVTTSPTTAVFTLLRGEAAVQGYVKNMAGDPIEGARVQPFPWFNPGTWGEQATDSTGYYQISNLMSGQYQIFCEASGYQKVDQVVHLYNGTNTVNFLMVKETALLVVQPTSLFLLGEYDGSVLTYSFNTLNGGASGTFTWTASASATPSHLITVTTPSGSEGDKITVQVDPRGLTVDSKYTGTLTVVGSGDSGTRQVPIEVLVVEDIYNSFLPMITKSCSP